MLRVVPEEQQPHEVSVALCKWLRHGLGGKLDPEGRVNSSWALLHALLPALPLRSVKPGANEEFVPGRRLLASGEEKLPGGSSAELGAGSLVGWLGQNHLGSCRLSPCSQSLGGGASWAGVPTAWLHTGVCSSQFHSADWA